MASLVSGSSQWTLVTDVTDFSSVATAYVDLTDTSTWTKVDVNSDIKTLAASGSNFNRITMNAMTGSTNNCWIAGSTCDAPRWHTPLFTTDATGQNVRLTSNDTFLLAIKLERGTITDSWNANVIAGVCADPTSATLNTIDGCGASFINTATAVPDYGVWTGNSSQHAGDNDAAGCFVGCIMASGLAQSTSVVFESDGTFNNRASKNNTKNAMSADIDLFLIVGVGTRGTGDAVLEDEDTSFRIQYKAIKLSPLA